MRVLPFLFRSTTGLEDSTKLNVLRVLNSIYVQSTVADDIDKLRIGAMNTTACEDLEDLIDAERNNWAKILASDQTDDDESGISSSIMGGISGGIARGVTSGTTVRIPSQLHNPTMTRIDTSAIEAAINANTFTISNHTSETPQLWKQNSLE